MLPQHVACHCPSLAEGTHSHAISDCWTFQVPSVSQLLGSLSGSGVQHPNVSGNTLRLAVPARIQEPMLHNTTGYDKVTLQ